MKRNLVQNPRKHSTKEVKIPEIINKNYIHEANFSTEKLPKKLTMRK